MVFVEMYNINAAGGLCRGPHAPFEQRLSAEGLDRAILIGVVRATFAQSDLMRSSDHLCDVQDMRAAANKAHRALEDVR